MNQRYKTILMWVLYAALFLVVMLLQTVVFGKVRFFGVKLSLIPVVLVCIAIFTGHEAGGLFSLIAAFVWYATGADDGPLSIITLTIAGILAGFLCSNVFAQRLVPALVISLAALLLHEFVLFLLKYYLGSAPFSLLTWVPKTALLSVLACPIFYGLAKVIRKVGEA